MRKTAAFAIIAATLLIGCGQETASNPTPPTKGDLQSYKPQSGSTAGLVPGGGKLSKSRPDQSGSAE